MLTPKSFGRNNSNSNNNSSTNNNNNKLSSVRLEQHEVENKQTDFFLFLFFNG